MKTFFVATIISAVFLGHAWARVGETEAQINARYGKSIGDIPTAFFGPVRGFAMPEFVVGVKLIDGLSVMEMISKNDQSEIAPPQIEALLKKHGADEAWDADSSSPPNWKRWHSHDGSLVAVYDTKRHFLYVNAQKFYDDQNKKIEAEKH